MNFFLFFSAEHKRRYFGECWLQSSWQSDFHQVNGVYNCSVTYVLQNIFFCVQQKKETHTGLE